MPTRYQRWWDGQRWTESRQELPPSAPVHVEPRNGLATTALVGGMAAAFVTLFGLGSGFGLDPLLVLLIVGCSTVAIGWGIAGVARARRLHPHLGRARAIWGLCLGSGSMLVVAVLLTVMFTASPAGGGLSNA